MGKEKEVDKIWMDEELKEAFLEKIKEEEKQKQIEKMTNEEKKREENKVFYITNFIIKHTNYDKTFLNEVEALFAERESKDKDFRVDRETAEEMKMNSKLRDKEIKKLQEELEPKKAI